MKILVSFIGLILIFSNLVFSQTATKIEVLDIRFHCGTLYKLDNINSTLQETPQSKIFVIYYEGQYRGFSSQRNKVNPRLEDALNKAKEIPIYLKRAYKVPDEKVVLIAGGFRQSLELEIWLVPTGAEIPKATPTLDRNDIKFAKSKPYQTKNLANCYSNY